MKQFLSVIYLLLILNLQVYTQCNYVGLNERTDTYTPGCTAQSTTVGSGNFQRFTVTNGVVYDFNTCGSLYDTKITGFNSSGTYVGLYNDDNAAGNNACGGGTASGVNWTATFSGELRLQMNEYLFGGPANCGTAQGSATLSYRIVPPNPGTYQYTTLYTCSSSGFTYNSAGTIVSNTVSSTFGNVFWQYGRPNGTWVYWGAGSTAPNNCCFPLNPASTDADRMRSYATNGPCTEFGTTVLVVSDNMTAPTSILGTDLLCSGTTSTTLTVNGGTAGVLGTPIWYEGGCGAGTSIGSGTSITVSPTSSTTYFVRYENPCTQTSCASVFVDVPTFVTNVNITDLSCFESNDGSINLEAHIDIPTFGNTLQLWTMASKGVVLNSSNQVTSWLDLSGNNRNFNVSVGSGVEVQSNRIGGLPSIRFNGSNAMSLNSSLNTTPYTMFVVARKNSNDGNTRRLISSASKNWLFGWHKGDNCLYTEGWVVNNTNGPQTGNPYFYTVSGSGSGTSFWSNGTQLANNSSAGLQAPGVIALGGYVFGNGQYSDGDVSEVIYYSKVLSTAEREKIENYLNAKYGITTTQTALTYLWGPDGETTEDISSLSAGFYNVTITDPTTTCSEDITGISVNQPIEINISGTVVNEICPTDNNGSIDITVSNTNQSSLPSQYSNLSLWVKADAGVVKAKDGNVLQWKDLSGNNNDFSVNFGTGIQQVASSIGGQPAIRFTGSQIMESKIPTNNPYTMIVVGRMTGGDNERLVSSGSLNWLFGWWGGNKDRMFAEGWVNQGNTTGITNSYIYSVSRNTGNTTFWSNGTQLASNTAGTAAPGIISLGGWGVGNSELSNGDISEVIVYNREITADERRSIEKYLSDKYGITISHNGVNPTYSWSPGGATTEDISSLDADSYTVTVTDASGCSNSETYTVTEQTVANSAFLVNNATITGAVEQCTEADGWTYYATPANPNDYVFGLHKNGNNIVVEVDITDEAGNATYSSTGGAGPDRGTWLIGRHWNATITNGGSIDPNNLVSVRFFVNPAEVTQAEAETDAFIAANAQAYVKTPLTFFKTPSGDFDPATAFSAGNFTFDAVILPHSTGTLNGVTYYELSGVKSFSGGSGGYSASDNTTPLPVELLNFSAKAVDNNYIQLDWTTATEVNNAGFELMRSTDGVNFEVITWVEGNGNSTETNFYSFDDTEVAAGTYYYQLKQIDFNGDNETFDIVNATITGEDRVSVGEVRPNPTTDNISFDISVLKESTTSMTVFNYTGQKVLNTSKKLKLGKNTITLDNVGELPAGAYYIVIELENDIYTKKFVVSK